MKKQPLISVIVASYNYAKYIKETLDFLIRQINKLFEVIVVDDGSRDQGLPIIEEYANRFKNIKLYTHPGNQNRGLTETVKLGIEKSNGKCIAFCESDDCWTSNHVEYLQDTTQQSPLANSIVSDIKVINLSNNPEHDSYVEFSSSFLKKHLGSNIFPYPDSNYIPTFFAVCIKKEVIQNINFNTPYPVWLDFWFWRQVRVLNKIYYIPQEVTLRRKYNESYDAVPDNKDFNGFIRSSDQYLVPRHSLSRIIANVNIPKDKKSLRQFIKSLCHFISLNNK